jgi:hypothetical protein
MQRKRKMVHIGEPSSETGDNTESSDDALKVESKA